MNLVDMKHIKNTRTQKCLKSIIWNKPLKKIPLRLRITDTAVLTPVVLRFDHKVNHRYFHSPASISSVESAKEVYNPSGKHQNPLPAKSNTHRLPAAPKMRHRQTTKLLLLRMTTFIPEKLPGQYANEHQQTDKHSC